MLIFVNTEFYYQRGPAQNIDQTLQRNGRALQLTH